MYLSWQLLSRSFDQYNNCIDMLLKELVFGSLYIQDRKVEKKCNVLVDFLVNHP
jgi:hypothetical protein